MSMIIERRRGSGGWIWPVVRGLGLSACGFGYLLAMLFGWILIASYVGAL